MQRQQGVDDCPICLAPLAAGKALFTTSCGHQFHFDCIKNLKDYAHTACPMCRNPVPQLNQITPIKNVQLLPQQQISHQQQQQQQLLLQQQQQQQQLQQQRQRLPINMNYIYSSAGMNQTRFGTLPANSNQEDVVDDIAVNKWINKNTLSTDEVKRTLTISSTLELEEVAARENKSLLAMLSIQAPSDQSTNTTRAPLDLVAVVDTSGSMSGSKITLVQHTLRFLLTQLSSLDRFCLVGFSSDATLFHNFKKIEDASSLGSYIAMLTATGGTSIGAGLDIALSALERRQSKNPVSSLLLLTDGQDQSVYNQLETLAKRLPDGCSAHSFGYGTDHDAKVLGRFAELTGGTFTYIENNAAVAPAFGNCLGGLLSVVAQNIVIDFELENGTRPEKVLSHYRSEISSKSVRVFLPDLFADEKRDIILSLEVPSMAPTPSVSIAQAKISYKDPLMNVGTDNVMSTEPVHFKISRPESVEGTKPANPKLILQRKRLSVVDALARATDEAQQNHFTKAKDILNEAICELLDLPKNSNVDNVARPADMFMASLLSDLQQSKQRVSSQSNWSQGGYAYVQGQQMQHQQQRNQSAGISAYATSAQCATQMHWNKNV
eukprot:TRINITY_DN172_c2_g1_i1.p1 TRINITY_DN172_c2_g1~~TRINITY_DN172_c2_g1_i1.p1  ORF type:complete len:617 (-),score=139.65 TRINITY_DN172_c2_g1_i1:82-1899(-)